MSLDIVVLAAGLGTRMKSSTPKIFHKIAGKPIIRYVIDTCKFVDPKNLIIVTTKEFEKNELFKDVKTCIQEIPKGTADAVLSALHLINSEYVIIMCSDMPLIEPRHLELFLNDKSDISFIAMRIPKDLRSMPYGRVIVDSDGVFQKITEYKNSSDEEKMCDLANSAIYKIKTSILKKYIKDIKPNEVNGELYFTDLLAIARKNNVSISLIEQDEYWPFHGINTMEDLANAEKIIQNKLRQHFMQNGVKLASPETAYFSHDSKISSDVVIEPNVVINESVSISSGAVIKSFCHLEDCAILENATIGPFARIRGNSVLQQSSTVGNFVEIKNSTLGTRSKAKHLSYIGDTIIGSDSNIGAGTITCNYDGVNKHKTVIDDNVMIGSNCSLIAPLTIGAGSIVAAGSVISLNVPQNSLAISRISQLIKPEKAIDIWKKKRDVK